jgi:hypothetical protein
MRTSRMIAAVGTVALASVFPFSGIGGAGGDDGKVLRTQLTGAQEVPPADPDGSARSTVEVPHEGQVCFSFAWRNIATPTAGHIHKEVAGANGPIVVGLLDGISPDQLESANHVHGCVSADPALLADIQAHPDQYYLNLHNPRFPGGAVRGQLG